MILFGNIAVPRAAVAELAVRLHEKGETMLAEHLGIANDEYRESFVIPPDDYGTVLGVLHKTPIPGLEQLADVLRHPPR